MIDQQDKPPRRSVVAIWHWPRWVWVAFCVMMPVAYLLLITPVAYCYCRCGNLSTTIATTTYHGVTQPAVSLAQHSRNYRSFVDFEWDLMTVFFGDVPGISGL